MVGIICKIDRTKEGTPNLQPLLTFLEHRGKFQSIRNLNADEFTSISDAAFSRVSIGVRTNQNVDLFTREAENLYVVDSLNKLDSSYVQTVHQFLINQDEGLGSFDSDELQNFVAIRIHNGGVTIWKSGDGQRAMYIAEDESSILLATEKKCLWYAGFSSVRPIAPNEIYQIAWDGKSQSGSSYSKEYSSWEGSQEKALDKLEKYFRDSLETIRGRNCGVLFSGGLDSSLLAKAARDLSSNILLFSSGAASSLDRQQTKQAAELLDFKRIFTDITPKIVWTCLPEVIYAAETCNRMDIEIALPFFICAEKAKEHDVDLLLSGQGPDELFAGSAKHVRLFKKEGPLALENQLKHEVSITHEVNISRDERVIAANGINAFFPYLEARFTRTALSLPSEWKIVLDKIPERKVIFRELALRMGLPAELALKPKKATQFSSGSSKMLISAVIQESGIGESLTKRQADGIVQDILNRIGLELGFPLVENHVKKIGLDLEPTHKFMEKRGLTLPQ